MASQLQAKEVTLEDLQDNFQLQLNNSASFFSEWREDLPSLTDEEKHYLDRVKRNYFNLVTRRPLLEEAVKMVILSPLLDLAGFYQSPFSIQTEASVEVTAEDEGVTVKGNIDVLVVSQRLWVLVIESKSIRFDVMTALPQGLAYMLANPVKTNPTFGFLVNGREFVFVKLLHSNPPQYSYSYALSIERDDEIYSVLSILKNIASSLSP